MEPVAEGREVHYEQVVALGWQARIVDTKGLEGYGKALVDAQHIALVTINRVDVLVSWNFKHIVNLQRIQSCNSVNLRFGYPLLEIRTPHEVIIYEEE